MPWKRTDDGALALDENNNPIRVGSDGQEYPFGDENLDGTLGKLEKLNRDEAGYRKTAEQLRNKYKTVEDIEDLESWRAEADKALSTVKNLDDKKLVDAGEVENLKKSISDSYEKKLKEVQDQVAAKDKELYTEKVSSRFAKSQALEKTVLTPDIAEAYFGRHFQIEDGQVVGYLGDEKIFSHQNPGQLADFDEALSEIIEKYPMKDKILKAAPGGSGTPPGGGGAPTSGDWHKLSPTERLNAARAGKIK